MPPVTNQVTRPVSRGLVAGCGAVFLVACSSTLRGVPERHRPAHLGQALPTAEQVEQAVGNPLDPGPEVDGSIAMLPNGIRDSKDVTPVECLGAATPLMRVVYEQGDVREVALRDFSRYGRGLTVSNVHTGVVRFASDAEAARIFTKFVTGWHACDGSTVSVHVTPTSTVDWRITEVREGGGILAATVLSGESRDKPGFPTEHAVGIASDCIVDVDVALTDTLPGRQVAAGRRAVGLVQAMLDNLRRAR